jgi:predicted phage gp36 major capsid-like protein
VQQTRRSLEALQRSEEDEALAKEELLLKTERLLSDALEGKASRHKGREDGWDHELARNEAPLEHRYDEAIHEVEARRRALRPPPPPSGRADDGHATPGTMLALIGGLVLLVALGIVFREVEHGSTGRARVVGLVGLALVAGGVGWNALRRQG